jgi:hypothetical protein
MGTHFLQQFGKVYLLVRRFRFIFYMHYMLSLSVSSVLLIVKATSGPGQSRQSVCFLRLPLGVNIISDKFSSRYGKEM